MTYKTKILITWLIAIPIIIFLCFLNYSINKKNKPKFFHGVSSDENSYLYWGPDEKLEYDTIVFVFDEENNKEMGRLTWEDGIFKFEGNAEDSARIFFEHFIKKHIDEYIKKHCGEEK